MLTLRKVAVTGRPGVGKSTVCRLFEDLGALTVSTDTIVHQLLSSNPKIAQRVEALLGPGILTEGKIDRQKVASTVFKDREKLKALEAILHPEVREVLKKLFQETIQTPIPLIIVEVPLLFEAHFENEFDKVIVVTSPLCRHPMNDLKVRTERFMPESEVIARADYHLTNESSLQALKTSIFNLYNQLLAP